MKRSLYKIKNAVACLFTLLLLLFAVACSDEAENVSVEQLMDQAYAAAHEGRWEDALKFSEQAYGQRPDDTSVRIMYALTLENNGRDNDALEAGRLAAEDTKSFLAQYTYGRMLFQRKKYDQAQPYLKQALALKDGDFNTLILLQQSAANLKQFKENQTYCKDLMKLYGAKRGADFSAYIYNEHALNILRGMPRRNSKVRRTLNQINALATKADSSSPELEWNQAIINDYYFNDFATAKKHYENFLKLTEKYSGMEKERAAVNDRLKAGN